MTDSIFGASEKALTVCEDRAVLLSNNVVNSSTPHYKAKDLDYHKIVQEAASQLQDDIVTTNPGHLKPQGTLDSGGSTLYRVPMQASKDGNTVDSELERKSFMENALNYQVNLTFIQNKSEQLMHAIKGE